MSLMEMVRECDLRRLNAEVVPLLLALEGLLLCIARSILAPGGDPQYVAPATIGTRGQHASWRLVFDGLPSAPSHSARGAAWLRPTDQALCVQVLVRIGLSCVDLSGLF